MASVLRGILGRKKLVLTSRKTQAMPVHTFPSGEHTRFEIDGWEFSLRDRHRSHFDRLEQWCIKHRLPVRMPFATFKNDFSIKHLDSGIAFRFGAYDAFRKFLEETTRNQLKSELPSYDSPLRAKNKWQFDCAYVGRIEIEKPGEKPKNINPIWEDIENFGQLDWTMQNEEISDIPFLVNYPRFCDHEAASIMKKKIGSIESNKARWSELLVNLGYNFHCQPFSYGFHARGLSSCQFNLVVTDDGWFVYLYQFVRPYEGVCRGFKPDGPKRTRMVMMHCAFKQNTIYREIVEEQSKGFEKIISMEMSSVFSKVNYMDELASLEQDDDEMLLHFYEAKQLRIPESCTQVGSTSTIVRAAKPISSFTFGEQKKSPIVQLDVPGVRRLSSSAVSVAESKTLPSSMPFVVLDVPDNMVKSLFAGGLLRCLEEKTRSRIQIIPLLRHPCNPKLAGLEVGGDISEIIPRKAYIYVSEGIDEKTKSTMLDVSNLADLWDRVGQF